MTPPSVPASLVGALLVALIPAVARAQPPVRDTRPIARVTGTASISGSVVTDDVDPRPIGQARVVVIGSETAQVRVTATDATGRFSLVGLPADRYLVAASRPPYIATAAGSRRAGRPGTPISVAQGQEVTGIVIRMRRGGALAGTITDESGEPAVGVNVRAVPFGALAGDTSLAALQLLGSGGTETDDRGVFRVFGLPPGDYMVAATPPRTGSDDVRRVTPAEVDAALGELRNAPASAPGGGRGRATGPPAIPPPGTPAAPAVPERQPAMSYVPVYYPGTTLASDAARITLGAGEERTGIDMRLELVRTSRIEGVVRSPDGTLPANLQVTLFGADWLPMMLGSIGQSMVRAGADGSFTIAGVAPGRYTVMARVGAQASFAAVALGVAQAPPVPAGPRPSAVWASADVVIGGQDVSGLVLSLQPGMSVSGRVAFDSTTRPPPKDLSTVRVFLAPPQPARILAASGGAQADAAGRFSISGLIPGKYLAGGAPLLSSPPDSPSEMFGWSLKSFVIGGTDVADVPFELKPGDDITDAVLTFTDRVQELSGTLLDPSGRPAPDYTIVVFPVDRRYWVSQSRRIQTTRPGTDGRFKLSGPGPLTLPAGEYYLAAMTDIAPNEQYDPALLSELIRASVRVTIREGERKVQDLRIRRAPFALIWLSPPPSSLQLPGRLSGRRRRRRP
jgi:hypothetical protein